MNRVDTIELREVRIIGERQDLNPFPSLASHFVSEGLKLLGYQPLQQSCVGQIPFMLRLKQIAFDLPSGLCICLYADKQRPAIAGRIDLGFRESTP